MFISDVYYNSYQFTAIQRANELPGYTVISPATGIWNNSCLCLKVRSFRLTSQRSFANAASWVRS